MKPNDDVKQYRFGCVFKTKGDNFGIQYEDKKRKRSITAWPQWMHAVDDNGQYMGWVLFFSCSFADACPEHLKEFLRDKWTYHVTTEWGDDDVPKLKFIR